MYLVDSSHLSMFEIALKSNTEHSLQRQPVAMYVRIYNYLKQEPPQIFYDEGNNYEEFHIYLSI